MTVLAVLGGRRRFAENVPFVRPSVPPLESVTSRLAPSYDAGLLTNGPLVRELEAAVAQRLGVRHVVAVANCTAGLMLAIRALDVEGEALLPSFTFSASAHAIAWNALRPRFAECDPASMQLDLDDAKGRLDSASLLVATHVFGAPCRPDAVEDLAASAGIPVVFDAAHAFGATHDGRAVGTFGDVEVFSLTPTKPLVAGEGGLVATNRDDVAESVRIGRDYANPGNYDTRFVGLNARMSELHAAVALESLARFDVDLARRRAIAQRYRDALSSVPGVRLQQVPAGDVSTYKDFTIAIDAGSFGIDRDALVIALRAEGVDTRCYFDPPVHRQYAYRDVEADLPVTRAVASQVVSLPIYPRLPDETVDAIAQVIADVGTHGADVARAIAAV
jgi:dTDP-4-amino-4,6-dideoxygalactose transaminase